ncbi:28S ribosomal protein S18c, mitochondrial [Pseudoliparis swirei]|uniref:28S ribosomal protein S18c, mitochondrial n=1 Tax=Pseudoliparis swirei TaxID=2059687 RepID=UPI0024BDA3D4|nr:28S ribosomal protein S18c, mitochondrial [Pseudoliparis swirei]
MLALRGLQRLKPVLSLHGNTTLRTITSHDIQQNDVIQQNDDMLVRMENPFKEPQKGCLLCNISVDFKNTQLLSQFISPHTGRTYGRHITGLCGRKQKEVSKAIKKAHALGFMSVTHKHPQFMRDPNVCGLRPLE